MLLDAAERCGVSFMPTGLQGSPKMISRRAVLSIAATLAVRARAVAGDFWKDRKPEEWSPQDIQRLMNKSPWAKEVVLAYSPAGGMPEGRGGWRGRGGGGGMGGGAGMGDRDRAP